MGNAGNGLFGVGKNKGAVSLLPILSLSEPNWQQLMLLWRNWEGAERRLKLGGCVAIPLEVAALGLCAKSCLLGEGSKLIFAYAHEKP